MEHQVKNNKNIKLGYLTTCKHYNTRFRPINPYYKPIVKIIDYEKLSISENTKIIQ
jgi:hypothetical protein